MRSSFFSSMPKRLPTTFAISVRPFSNCSPYAGTSISSRPYVGMQYSLWFNGQDGNCQQSGWYSNRLRPFKSSYPVYSLAMPRGRGCYSLANPATAFNHGYLMAQLGVDFMLLDLTNNPKFVAPDNCPEYQNILPVLRGFKDANVFRKSFPPDRQKLKITFHLSLTCWAEQYYENFLSGGLNQKRAMERFSPNGQGPGKTEFFIFKNPTMEYLSKLYQLHENTKYEAGGSDVMTWNQKPLVIFYCNTGHQMYDPGDTWTGTTTFKNKWEGNPGQFPNYHFNPEIEVTINGTRIRTQLNELFTVRFSIYQPNAFNVTPYSKEVWPFMCDVKPDAGNVDSVPTFDEAGYASLVTKDAPRSVDTFKAFIDVYKRKSVKLFFIRSWNEFSTTDEVCNNAHTIEPNNFHSEDPNSYSGASPHWTYFDGIKRTLSTL